MLRYSKMEGCGNDFVVVDLRHAPGNSDGPSANTELAAEAVCDRHFGIGADGLLAILPPATAGAVARMRVLNADGSEAEMCGNGIRCVAKFLYEHEPAARLPELLIDTGAGPLRCGVTVDNRRHVTQVSVGMGRPRLSASEVPVELPAAAARPDGRVLRQAITVEDRTFHFTAVSMGNPHAVVFVENDPAVGLRALAERFGPSLERHPWFPRRTNVEFARRLGAGHFELVVWERGCGITLACGTGACATAVAACLNQLATPGEEIRISLLGGDLMIKVDAELGGVTMRGPADTVFEGELDLAALVTRHQARHSSRGSRTMIERVTVVKSGPVTGPKVTSIRRARPGDAHALRRLLLELGYDPGDARTADETIAQVVRHPEAAVFVAVEGIEVVGYVAMSHRPQMRLGGRLASIDELLVSETRRDQGIGSRLVAAAVEHARSLLCLRVDVTQRRSRESYEREFYQNCGFEEMPSAVLRLRLQQPAPQRR